jgi:hypothetical protein
MPEQFIEIIDRFGRRRRARRGEVAGDGETVHFGMQFMDGTARAVRDALAEKFGPHTGDDDMLNDHRPRGYVRGYAVSDATVALASRDAARFADEAERAYAERSRRMANLWRKDHRDAVVDEPAPRRAATLGELRAQADAAYQAKCERLRNAWRTNR